MAVAFRSANGSASANPASSNQLTVSAPAGIQNADILVAILAMLSAAGGAFGTITAVPSGWTLLDTQNVTSTGNANANVGAFAYWKPAGGSEPGTYSWTMSGTTTPWAGSIAAVSGGNSIDTHGSAKTTTDATTLATPVESVLIANDFILQGCVSAAAPLSAGPTFTWPASTTGDDQRAVAAGAGGTPSSTIGHDNANLASTGNTTARTITVSVSGPIATFTVPIAPLVIPPVFSPKLIGSSLNRASNY